MLENVSCLLQSKEHLALRFLLFFVNIFSPKINYSKYHQERFKIGSILLNIHEVWPRPFWRGSSHQKKTLWVISLVICAFASLEGDKRPDKINQNQESLNILCPKQENNVSIFRVSPLIKIICLFAAD